MATFLLVQNDTGIVMNATLRDGNRQPIDLTDAIVRFHCGTEGDPDGVIVDAEAVIVDAEGGRVSYTWMAEDTAQSGLWDAEFEIRWGETIRTVPSRSGAFKVNIRSEVA